MHSDVGARAKPSLFPLTLMTSGAARVAIDSNSPEALIASTDVALLQPSSQLAQSSPVPASNSSPIT